MPHGHDLEARLHDILDEIKGIRDATIGLSHEIFEDVWVIRRASERGIEIISEASRHIPDDLKSQTSDIPWREIAGIGNVLRHNYENISSKVVWDIITRHLDPLEEAVRSLLARIESADAPE